MGAWINCQRKIGQAQKSCHNLAIATIQMIIPNMSKDGKVKDFYNLASNECMWVDTMKKYEEQINTNNTNANDDEEDEIALNISSDKYIFTFTFTFIFIFTFTFTVP
jgi:hypothetical protein